jgi:hypothetical protein
LHAGGQEFDPPWLHHQSYSALAHTARDLIGLLGKLKRYRSLTTRKSVPRKNVRRLTFNKNASARAQAGAGVLKRKREKSQLANNTAKPAVACCQDHSLSGSLRRTGPLGLYGQVNKRIRWMPRQSEAMKDVVACEKPRGACKLALIRGCPNGETRRV